MCCPHWPRCLSHPSLRSLLDEQRQSPRLWVSSCCPQSLRVSGGQPSYSLFQISALSKDFQVKRWVIAIMIVFISDNVQWQHSDGRGFEGWSLTVTGESSSWWWRPWSHQDKSLQDAKTRSRRSERLGAYPSPDTVSPASARGGRSQGRSRNTSEARATSAIPL